MASGGLTFTVNTSNLERKLKAWRQNLHDKLKAEWQAIASECLINIAARAPDPTIELQYILGGNFPEVTAIPAASGRNASAYPYSGERVHFDRTPGMWIRDAIMSPGASAIDASNLSISLGIVPVLEELTRFSWVNFSRKLGSFPHTSPYGVWSFFEYGTSNHISENDRTYTGNKYKLKPQGASPNSTWEWDMVKTYPPFRMYSDFDPAFLRNAIATRLRAVKY